MTAQPALDQAKVEAFTHKAFGDVTGMYVTLMCAIGDHLGLFKHLAANGPATSIELANRTGLNERYTREWLGGMACAGYLEYDPASSRFTLPPEHAPVLAQEDGPMFFGGFYHMMPYIVEPFGQLLQAFRQGGGIHQSVYNDKMWDGGERFTASWFENLLVQQWLPIMPDVQAKLEQGAGVADVGCGRGRALIKLAQAFPKSYYTGYDAFEPTIARATANAEAAGVANRVSFQQLDVSKGLPEQYDVITTFDVIHDAVDPLGVLRAIRQGLRADGIYVCLDINCSDKLEENIGPLGAMFHGGSIFYCMTTSLAGGGVGLGTLGFHETKVRELCAEAGFRTVRRVPMENPFNNLYEIRP